MVVQEKENIPPLLNPLSSPIPPLPGGGGNDDADDDDDDGTLFVLKGKRKLQRRRGLGKVVGAVKNKRQKK